MLAERALDDALATRLERNSTGRTRVGLDLFLLRIACRLSLIAYRLSLIAYRLSLIAYRLSLVAYRSSLQGPRYSDQKNTTGHGHIKFLERACSITVATMLRAGLTLYSSLQCSADTRPAQPNKAASCGRSCNRQFFYVFVL